MAVRLFGKPQTRTGRWAIAFIGAFVAALILAILWGTRASNPRAGFWADPLGAFLIISTAVFGASAGIASAIAIIRQHERSLLVFLTLIVGAFVLYFTAGELLE